MDWLWWSCIAAGGAIGSLLRSAVVHGFLKFKEVPPQAGTLAVNLVGCLLMGVILGMASRFAIPEWVRALLVSGGLGAFTTFSAYGKDVFTMFQLGQFGSSLIYIFLSNLGGFLLIWLGFLVAR